MDSKSFVNALFDAAPTIDQLLSLGVSPKGAIDMFNSYQAQFLGTEFQYDDELLNLIANYDTGKIEIGMVCFTADMQEDDSYYFIGAYEADLLAYSKVEKEVVVLDYGTHDLLWRCAVDGEHFLDAMLIAAKFLTQLMLDKNDELYNPETILIQVQECTQKAGGKEYRDFYENLLGYYE